MSERDHRILLVEPDPDLMEMLVAALDRRFNASITCVATAEACLDVELLQPHDAVIAAWTLDDSCALCLVEQLASLGKRPVILIAGEEEVTPQEAAEAIRLHVAELFVKPFPVSDLLDGVARTLAASALHRRQQAKYHRMRNLVRHVIRERRSLNQRVELICRDLVGAHRRLVQRVLASQGSGT